MVIEIIKPLRVFRGGFFYGLKVQVEKLKILDKFLSFLNADNGEERWVTIKGQHVKIDGDGNIVAGNPKVAGGDSKVTSGKSDIDFGGGKYKTKSDVDTRHLEKEAEHFRMIIETAKKDGRDAPASKASLEKIEKEIAKKKSGAGKTKSVKMPSEIKKSGGNYEKDTNKIAEAIKNLSGGKIDAYVQTSGQSESTYLYLRREDSDKSYKIRISDHDDKHGGNDFNWSPKDDTVESFYKKLQSYLEDMGATNFGDIFPKSEKQNASDFPKYYFARHMQAGLCGYEDETILVDTDAVVKLGNTFKGKPVYIQHQDVKLETLKEDAVGYVQNTFMGVDGWLWSEIMITDDEAHEVIAKGWSVSNAYIPTEWGTEGSKNNIPYDREVLNGEFTHLALVPNPRYEGAKIYTPEQYQARNTQLVNSLANSKPTEKKGFSMIFWKKEKVSDSAQADFVEYTNDKGETVVKSIEEMKNALEAEAKQAEIQAKKVLVNGKEMTVAELTKAYEKLNAKKKNEADEEKENEDEDEKENEDDEDEKENEAELVTETRVNEDDEDLENEDDEDEEKTNSKPNHFKTMKNAHMKNSTGRIVIETRAAQIQRGRELFSRQKGN